MYNPCYMLRWVGLLAICSVGWATPLCVTTTLDNYIALGGGGCLVGGLTVTNFGYAFSSGVDNIPDTSITVTPSLGPDTLELQFSSPDFSESSGDLAVYQLTYEWDPGDIRSLEDILDPPSFPGLVQITSVDCENAAFSVGCPFSDTLVVSDNGVTMNLENSVSFSPPVASLGIQDTIDLDSSSGGTAAFTYFANQLTIPEPSTAAPCLLLAACLWRRLRLQRV